MNPVLLILAAGMGSRYGGLKQIDKIGPSGETLMDYSVYDAIRVGFGKVVFVIRRDFGMEFRDTFSVKRFGEQIDVDYVFQSVDSIPEPFVINPQRTKPWGANHALMMAAEVIHEPFAVLNADDFYGYKSFELIASFLNNCDANSSEYCMAGYRLGNTLSEKGGVTRAVCNLNEDHTLRGITEYHSMERINGIIQYSNDTGRALPLAENALVSMNFWGFTPGYFEQSETIFREFLAENLNDLKAEIHIPYVVNELIKEHKAVVQVKETSANWFGVTWPGDREVVVQKLKELSDTGQYPHKLWQK